MVICGRVTTVRNYQQLRDEREKRLQSELHRITEQLKSVGVQKIILFGSLAHGQAGLTTDIDLIVVYETDKRFLDRLEELYAVARPKMALDILAYTPQEFERLREERRFVKDAVATGKVLYEAQQP